MIGTRTAVVLASLSLLATLGILGFHLATFTHANLTAVAGPLLLPLFGAGMALVIAMIGDGVARFDRARSRSTGVWRLLDRAPWPIGLPLVLSLGYWPINFFACLIATHGYTARQEGGTYLLVNHAQVIRAITRAEYIQYQSYSLRLLTGCILPFYLASAVYFLACVRQASSGRGSGLDRQDETRLPGVGA
jgi:hypothetical protein